MGRSGVQVGRSDAALGRFENSDSRTGSDGPTEDDGAACSVEELRTRGLSIRAISERTGIPRSTVAEHVTRVKDAMPIRITGRDGRRYHAVRDPRLDEPAAGSSPADATGQDAPGLVDPDRELRRLLVLAFLRQARDLVPDVVPLAEHDRLRLALDLAAITRMAGIRDGDVATARMARRRGLGDDCP